MPGVRHDGGASSPALSADRQSLIYLDRTDDALRTIAVDGSGDRILLAKLKGCASITHITWNPIDQGRHLHLRRPIDGSAAGRLLRLYIVKVADRSARRLDVAAADLSTPVWSRR